MNIILLGSPGAGKGTQSQFLCQKYHLQAVSTGDMFREARKNKTDLGKEVETYMLAGQLVPDDLVIRMVSERLSRGDCGAGFVLDGFPRTIAQADALEAWLNKQHQGIDVVLSLSVPDEVVIRRLSGRRVCHQCGANYHVDFAPSRNKDVCDRCGGEVVQRKDDAEETIKQRLKVYHDETQPLIDYYTKKDLLQSVSGVGEMQAVWQRVQGILDQPSCVKRCDCY